MKATVYVTLKSGVLDPQGKAVASALGSLGFAEVADVRQGKFIEIELKETNKDAAKRRIEEMCQKLLANTVIEDYKFDIAA